MKNAKLLSILLSFFLLFSNAFGQQKSIDQKVENLLKQMTVEEKVGQLTQYSGNNKATGPVTFKGNHQELIKSGR